MLYGRCPIANVDGRQDLEAKGETDLGIDFDFCEIESVPRISKSFNSLGPGSFGGANVSVEQRAPCDPPRNP